MCAAPETKSALDETGQAVPVAAVEDVLPGTMKRFVVSNRGVVLANVDGTYYAFEDRCRHWGVRLSDGALEGCVVRCRAHGWRHDIARGEVVASQPPGDEGQRLTTFDVEINDGKICVGARARQQK